MTRRDLGISFAAAAALAQRPVDPLQAAQAPAPDLDSAAREQVQRTGETLRKFKIPIATEPSVTFHP